MATITFCSYSDTIRQMPENYLLAEFFPRRNCWIADPDLAANKEIATKVFHALLDFKNRYEHDGQKLVDRINSGK